MPTILDPSGLYGGDPDYEDWKDASQGKLNFGFVYENKLFSQYKDIGVVSPGFTPAGAINTAADLQLWVPSYTSSTRQPTSGSNIKIEVKLDVNADYGQSSLEHNGSNWVLKGASTPEAVQMRQLLTGMGVIPKINQAWPGRPNLFKYNSSSLVPDNEKQQDYQNYQSSYITGPEFSRAFSSYYSSKGVHYIQIGGYGLYSLNTDPNNLRFIGVSSFLTSGATMKLRIRVKGSSSQGTYRFSTALLMDNPPRTSGFNLDDNSDMERLRWDAVNCRNAPGSLSKQRSSIR